MVPVLFEDNHLLVINKPAGILSQGDGHRESLVEILKEYIKVSANKSGNVYLGGIHRLDAPVSGAMVFAKTSKAASRLAQMIKDNEIVKIYIAVSASSRKIELSDGWKHFKGSFERPAAITTVYHDNRTSTGVEHYYKILAQKGSEVVSAIRLVTGRKHQIRAFLKSINLPVSGDAAYGAVPLKNKENAILLHAAILSFTHPVRKEGLHITAPLPEYFPGWVRDLRISENLEL